MPAECIFTLPNARKCRCMATRGHAFCRHHGAPRKPRLPRSEQVWNRRSCWIHTGRELQEIPKEEIPGYVLNFLQGLLEDRVSDRFAGRCIRVLLQRLGRLPVPLSPDLEGPDEEPVFLPPPPRSRRTAGPAQPGAEPEPELEPEPSQAQLIQWALSTLGMDSLPGSRPSNGHSQPQAPAPAATR